MGAYSQTPVLSVVLLFLYMGTIRAGCHEAFTILWSKMALAFLCAVESEVGL